MSYRDDFREVHGNALWSIPRVFIAISLVLVMSYGIGFLLTGGDLAIYRFWAPKYADAQREVFTHTNSYVQGKVSHLTQLQLDYESATGAQRQTLRTVILTEAAQVDGDKLPTNLRAFLSSLRSDQ